MCDENGGHLNQDISSMEKKYQGKWDYAMLADYCWTLARDAHTQRQAKRKKKYMILFELNNKLT